MTDLHRKGGLLEAPLDDHEHRYSSPDPVIDGPGGFVDLDDLIGGLRPLLATHTIAP